MVGLPPKKFEGAIMLYIKDDEVGNTEWHVGDPVPEIKSRVVTFQADGHELELILSALAAGTYLVQPDDGF